MAGLVAVTGANGFIGTHLVQQLLSTTKHRVRAVVRDPSNPKKVVHLQQLPHQDRLEFAKGELKEEDYIIAFKGVETVIHLATPYMYSAPDPDKEIVQPAIHGAISALRASVANKAKRFVFCSSGTAAMTVPHSPGKRYTVDDWNQTSSLTNNPYWLSKRLAEQECWKFSKEHPEIEFVVVNPFYVLGPTEAGDNLNQSMANMKRMLMDEPGLMPAQLGLGVVDVRDVARAFVLAVEQPEAKGKRLFAVEGVTTLGDIRKLIKKHFPQYPVGKVDLPDTPKPDFSIDNQPLAALGLKKYIGLETMVVDTIKSLIAAKVVPDTPAK